MQGKTGDIARLQHVLEAISEIEKYTNHRGFSDFIDDTMFRFACIKQLEIIGEASDRISKETIAKFSEIEWTQIVGMRNVFVHEYFGIDLTIAWQIIQLDIPELKIKILQMIEEMGE